MGCAVIAVAFVPDVLDLIKRFRLALIDFFHKLRIHFFAPSAPFRSDVQCAVKQAVFGGYKVDPVLYGACIMTSAVKVNVDPCAAVGDRSVVPQGTDNVLKHLHVTVVCEDGADDLAIIRHLE